MAKLKLNEMTQEQLEAYEKQLEQEIDSLTKVVEASNTTVFDILINEVKEEMRNNIAEEEWKVLKENQKKIESYRSIEKALQNQEDLLDKKEEELANVQDALRHYQTHLFESQPEEERAVDTGFTFGTCGQSIVVGDVYKARSIDVVGNPIYYIIKKSAEMEGSFAIAGTNFDDEKLLQYPANREILETTSYVGNIYIEDDLYQDALSALEWFAGQKESFTSESEINSEEGEDEEE